MKFHLGCLQLEKILHRPIAAVMLRRPEETKERVEAMTLGMTAIEIPRNPAQPGSLCYCCYELSLVGDIIMSPHTHDRVEN